MSNTSFMLSTATPLASSAERVEPDARPAEADQLLIITPPSRWSALNLREVWRFRDLLFTFASRDLKLRYKQTAMGVAWVVLQPLLTSVVFTVVFGLLARFGDDVGVNYFMFSFAGLLGWNLFNTVLSRSSACLVGNSNMISKIYFPRLVLPTSTIGAALVDFGVALVTFFILTPFFHIPPHLSMLALPLWIGLVLLTSLGIGLWAAALTVSYRDVQYILPVFLNTLMYASPIAYPVAKALTSHRLKYVFYLNPLSGVFEGFRWSLVGTTAPTPAMVVYAIGFSIVAFLAGAIAFKQMERKFADVI